MAQTEFTKIWEQGAEAERKKILGQLLIAQQDPNITPETDLEGFQNQGGYAPESGTRTPGPITPRQKGKNVRQGDSAQRRNEAARGGEQLTPEEIWPNYPNMLQIEGGMPPEINPGAWDPRKERRKQRIRDLKQGNQNPNEKKSAEQKQSPRERIDIPDFLQNININPRDALMILPALLQLLNPLQGQMADAEPLPQEQLMANVSPEALDALRRGAKKGLSSREIRDILKPYTQNDQFGNPSGSIRGV